MNRRDFLYTSGALLMSAMLPSTFYQDQSPQEEQQASKDICVDIVDNQIKPNKHQKLYTHEWSKELENQDLKVIADKARDVLNSNYFTTSECMKLDIHPQDLQKLITTNPYFAIPLTTQVLFDYQKINEDYLISSAATIKEGGLEKSLWFTKKEAEKDEIKSRIAIPYQDDEKTFIYGDGEQWGIRGAFVSLITHRNAEGVEEESKTNVHMDFFVDIKIRGLGSLFARTLGKGVAKRRLREETAKLFKNSESLYTYLQRKEIIIGKGQYPEEKVAYLQQILE